MHRSKDSKPSMHALKESGDIENAADIVLLMHRPENGEFDVEKKAEKIWLRIAKNRDGKTTAWTGNGAIRLWWQPAFTRFLNDSNDWRN
ncbi:MAG: hypothetical protein DRN20_03520 [Thermoplasmata archaeon]|nr:MAG: hypothetical protein DRN20_03520 [Thermoplasmata archaeon]